MRDERGESKVLGALVLCAFVGVVLLGSFLQRPALPALTDPRCDGVRAPHSSTVLPGEAAGDPVSVGPDAVVEVETAVDYRWYRAVRCVQLTTARDGAVTLGIFVADLSEEDIADELIDVDADEVVEAARGELPGDRALLTTYTYDGSEHARLQFHRTRILVNVFASAPLGHASVRQLTAEVLEHGRSVDGALVDLPDIAGLDRRLRDELAVSWGGVVAVLMALGVLLSLTTDLSWLMRLLLGVESLRRRVRREPPEEDPPGVDLRPRLRVRRRVRVLAGLLGAAAIAVGFTVFVRLLPADEGLVRVSAYAGVAFAVMDVARVLVVGSSERYRFLRVIDRRAAATRVLLTVLEGASVAVLVYGCGRLAMAWELLGGSMASAGTLFLNVLFGPLALLAVGATWRGLRVLLNWDAARVLRADRRPEVVLLRSFDDDSLKLRTRWTLFQPVHTIFDLDRTETFEAVLVRLIWPIGPVLALARPDSRLRPLGAARSWHGPDEWQEVVRERVLRSRLIVVIAGTTSALSWELEQLRSLGLLPRTVVVFPPVQDPEASAIRVGTIADTLGSVEPWAHYAGDPALIALRFREDDTVVAAYVDVTDDIAYQHMVREFAAVDLTDLKIASDIGSAQLIAARRHRELVVHHLGRARTSPTPAEHVEHAVTHALASLSGWRDIGDEDEIVRALFLLGRCHERLDVPAEADAAFAEAVARCRIARQFVRGYIFQGWRIDARWRMGAPPDEAASDLAHVVAPHHPDLGESLFEQARAGARDLASPDPRREALIVHQHATLARRSGDSRRVRELEDEAITIANGGVDLSRPAVVACLDREAGRVILRAHQTALTAGDDDLGPRRVLRALLETSVDARAAMLACGWSESTLDSSEHEHRLEADGRSRALPFSAELDSCLVEALLQSVRAGSTDVTVHHLLVGLLVVGADGTDLRDLLGDVDLTPVFGGEGLAFPRA